MTESRHLIPAEKLLSEKLGGKMVRHPWDRESRARLDSLRVEMLGWTPEDGWKR